MVRQNPGKLPPGAPRAFAARCSAHWRKSGQAVDLLGTPPPRSPRVVRVRLDATPALVAMLNKLIDALHVA